MRSAVRSLYIAVRSRSLYSLLDLVFIGCGTERSSLRALELLLPFRDAFSAFLSGGGLLLLTGTAYEIFCRTIRDDGQDGAVFELFRP